MPQRDAAASAGLLRIERLHIVRRQTQALQQRVHLRDAGRGFQPQQALRAARHRVPVQRGLHGRARRQRRGAVETRVHAVLRVDDAVEQAGWVTRCLGRDPRPTFEQRAAPALSGQGPGGSAAGQAAADDQRVRLAGIARCAARGCAARRERRREAGERDVALAEAALAESHVETGAGQAVAQGMRRAPGGHGGAGCGEPAKRLADARVPHARVGRGREAVEVERIDRGHQLGQPGLDIAEREQQPDPAGLELQAVQVRRERRPGLLQGLGQLGQRRAAVHRGQIVARQRVLLDRDEDQLRAALRVVAPGLPGREEVVAQAEAGFQHDEALAALPAPRQFVAAEEDMARLRQRAGARVIDVLVLG